MYNPKSKAPLIVVVCARTHACDELVGKIRAFAPQLRIGKIAHCDLQRAVKNLLVRNTPLAAVIHFQPKATGHVDLIPAGIAHTLMNTAKTTLLNVNEFSPAFILYTDADKKTVAEMTAPIPAISGIRPENIHIAKPGALGNLEQLLSVYAAPPREAAKKVRHKPRHASRQRPRSAHARFAANFSR